MENNIEKAARGIPRNEYSLDDYTDPSTEQTSNWTPILKLIGGLVIAIILIAIKYFT
jgi:hypothetical protein